MKIVLTHGYSATNSGDGLLVAEAMRLANDAFMEVPSHLFASDPDSFQAPSGCDILHPITGGHVTPSSLIVVVAWLWNVLCGRRGLSGRAKRVVDSADVVLAVGGGYLRAKSLGEYLKMLIIHVPQLPTKRRAQGTTYVYLPQSIGPFNRIGWHLLHLRLAWANLVIVRDERSRVEFGPDRCIRMPDLAILGFPEVKPSKTSRGITGIVARQLTGSRASTYRKRIHELYLVSGGRYLLQAGARGNNDQTLYSCFDSSAVPAQALRDSLASDDDRPDVVVSVRLHGALESARAGVPAIHLSYERKGWGAFEDLGIDEYVHNAYCFDPHAVHRQVEELRASTDAYWEAIHTGLVTARRTRDSLVDNLRALVLNT